MLDTILNVVLWVMGVYGIAMSVLMWASVVEDIKEINRKCEEFGRWKEKQ